MADYYENTKKVGKKFFGLLNRYEDEIVEVKVLATNNTDGLVDSEDSRFNDKVLIELPDKTKRIVYAFEIFKS